MDTDPLDLEAFRRNAYALVDWVVDYLGGLEDRPVREPAQPGDVRAKLPGRAPEDPEAFDAVLADLERVVVPGLTHWQHPGWFAYFPAQSSPPAILGELAAAGMGVQGMLWSTSPAATEIESHVLDWLVDLLGVPQEWKTSGPGGGVLQSGASASTHTALVVAREQCLLRSGAGPKDMVAYTSSHAHSSIEKGARMAGYGHIRMLPTDPEFAARPDALSATVAEDRRAGLAPAFVCSAVGTTGTTGVDPVRRFGEIARAGQMWHHVDAAYAGSAMICEEFRHHQDGLELVDSYTFNPHKWLATNLDCSVMWVADRRPLIEALSVLPPYLRDEASESGQVIDYRDWHGPLGRPFRALKLWFVLRCFGAAGLREMIRTHVAWARELAGRIDAHRKLATVAPTPFGLVSFAHVDGNGATDALVDRINDDGRFYITASTADGMRYARISVGSTWTARAHVEALWDLIDASV
ncbi:MAG: aspartate aminotransferase family protein [Acidimicrobiaceae bacterium]|nr:aspartate aminotransferase family protein [Acidimicrobiaceae bacterium]MYL03804.1 aspartate aminotransferase family protein [Acidimicrobiaceae bacterium]